MVETTRPELLAACVALVAHPGDDRYRDLVGTTATTPLFGVPVPVVAHRLADPGKGTGLAMICTFGDLTDVLWWRELQLPVRSVVTRDGRLQTDPPDGVPGGPAWDELAGQTTAEARRRVVGLLRAAGDLVGEPRPVTHPVKFYENGDRPLEIVTSRQWFIRLLAHRERLLERGRALEWQPPYMRTRYEHWVTGLHSDWLVSRQRFFGVPVPLWYPLTEDGEVDHDHPIVPDEARLPVDPSTDVPDGYQAADRGRPGGFTGDPDVFDTWATSSLTPQIAGGWEEDPERFARVFPMHLRPQAHEIIRTWLFYTVVRSDFEHGTLPWTRAAISGWVIDPDRRKMSKSKGNVVTPTAMLERYGADALRYWAAGGRPGTDTAVDEGQMRVGRRLAVKLLNSGRFILSLPEDGPDAGGPAEPLDLAMLAGLDAVVAERHRGPGGRRLDGRPRAGGAVLLVVLRRLPGAGQGPGLPAGGRAGRQSGQGGPARRPGRPAAAAGPLPPVRLRGGVVVVARRLGPSGPLAGTGARRCRRGRPAAAGGGQRGHRRSPAGQEPGQAAPAHPGGPGRGQRPAVVAGRRPGGRDRPGRGRAGGGVRVP